MSQSGKWIEGIAPDSGVREAARLSLEARLAAVARLLPLAATKFAEDVEHVHRLRVATRRAVAALRLYRDWLPRKPFRWMKKRLRKIRRAAGEARDLDVLIGRLHQEIGERAAGLLGELTEERAAAQPAIEIANEKCLRKDRFQRQVHELLAGIGPHGKLGKAEGELSFQAWAERKLHDTAGQFFAALPGESNDVAILHQFRIRGKALRYAIELLSPAFGPELRGEHYPVVEQLQERLGGINDHVTGSARLRAWSEEVDFEPHRELLGELAAQEDARRTEAIAEFHQWWTAERVETLRLGLAANQA